MLELIGAMERPANRYDHPMRQCCGPVLTFSPQT